MEFDAVRIDELVADLHRCLAAINLGGDNFLMTAPSKM
jgi:hypothetical protein